MYFYFLGNVPYCFPQQPYCFMFLPVVHKGSNFSRFSPALSIFCFFESSHLNRYEVVLHFRFGLCLMSDVEYLCMHLLTSCIFSLETCLFKSFAYFWTGWFFAVEFSLYIMSINPLQLKALQIFFPILSIAFLFYWYCLLVHKLLKVSRSLLH